MSAFEFFFSFYGLLLALSVAVIATGAATAIQHRHEVKIGYLTPLLTVFVALDIASFWDGAWTSFRHLPFSYGLLVVGLVIAVVYFIAASLVFPHEVKAGTSLDDHFWANKRVVLLLLIAANLLVYVAMVIANLGRPNGMVIILSYTATIGLYVILIGLAAWARKARLTVTMLTLHIVIYLLVAVNSVLTAQPASAEDPPPAVAAK